VPLEVYKLLHLLGLIMSMVAVGGLALHGMNGGDRSTNGARGLASATHGIGMLLLLVGGFGMLARLGSGFPPWIAGKLVIWLIIGASMMPLMRKPELGRVLWMAIPVLAIIAAAMGIYKPGA
jgi:xanthine/uracil permease